MRYPEYTLLTPPPTFGCARPACLGGRPPLNEVVGAIVSIAASVASTAISYDSSQNQARQVELNAEAQNEALKAEQDRQAAEFAENQRRTVKEHNRQRAQQAAALASTGALQGTGTAIALMSDTWITQQVQLGDQSSVHALGQRDLAYRGSSALAMGRSQAASLRAQGVGTALGQLAQTGYQAYGMLKKEPKPAGQG